MANLINLQTKFQSYLMNADSNIHADIEETTKVSATKRLQIYRNAYQFRLIEALSSNYPILHRYLGDESFEALTLLYLRNYPSTFRSIRWFGDQLNVFLQTHDRYAEFPYLAELSTLEWHMTLTFDAADRGLIDMEAVMQIPPNHWPMMQFTPHPSVYLLDFQWNVVELWQNLSKDHPHHEPIQHDLPIAYLFWRKELMNQYCSLPNDERFAIHAMMNGHTFGEICEGLCQWVDEQGAALRAASLLKGWINSGLLSAINLN